MKKEGLFVDNFAGGGGASTGIEIAIGRDVDIAINHDPDAITMHKANHPNTKHLCENVWEVDPIKECAGRPVTLAWFSPDCTHFSRAKGGKPVDKNIRGLAWVTIRWAMLVRPKVIMLENVSEIQTWGPLMPQVDKATGRMLKIVGYKRKRPLIEIADEGEIVPPEKQVFIPDPKRTGETFNGFIDILSRGISKDHPAFIECCNALVISPDSDYGDKLSKGLGYDIEWRELKSCDYGTPTTRKRFYMIARSDGRPIVWPEPAYAPKDSLEVKNGKKMPYHSAAECIDWDIPAVSIFERNKPLAENTLKRIARGIQKFVIDNPKPFIVNYKFDNEPESVEKPLSTITAVGNHSVVTPMIVQVNHKGDNFRGQDVDKPLGTITAKHGYALATPTIMCNNTGHPGAKVDAPLPTITTGNHEYLVAPSIIPVGYGEAKEQKPRVNSVEEPLGTIVTSGKHHLVAPTLIQYHSETSKDEVRGQSLEDPIMTIDTTPRYALSCAHIMKNYGGNYKGAGSSADKPLDTITAKDHNELVTAHIMKYYAGNYEGVGSDVNEPLHTITAEPRHYLATAHIMTMRNNMDGQKVDEPLTTISCSGAHHAEVQTFLRKYFPNCNSEKPAIVKIHGEEYIIVDIKMRMLQPRELFRCNGFPNNYIIERDAEGNPYSKSKQVARCGNAVTPQVATALVRANLPEYCQKEA